MQWRMTLKKKATLSCDIEKEIDLLDFLKKI
jgi:hypothetical protein